MFHVKQLFPLRNKISVPFDLIGQQVFIIKLPPNIVIYLHYDRIRKNKLIKKINQ
jgi:hypothetical protein